MDLCLQHNQYKFTYHLCYSNAITKKIRIALVNIESLHLIMRISLLEYLIVTVIDIRFYIKVSIHFSFYN